MLRAWPQRWQSTAVTRVRREVIEGSSPDSCYDLVDGDMHGIRSQLLPGHSPRGVDHKDRMAVHRPHVHAAWKAEHPEAGAKHVISILKDRKPAVQLSRKDGRNASPADAHPHHLTAGSLDCIQLSLH